MLLMATGFTNRDSVCVCLPIEYKSKTSASQYVVSFDYLKNKNHVFVILYITVSVSEGEIKMGSAGKIFATILSQHSYRQTDRGNINIMSSMGRMMLLGVFALLVSGGWRTVLVAGVRLRQQGAIALLKNSAELVLGGNIEVFF